MVLKLHKAWFYSVLVFENDVKMYGTQTDLLGSLFMELFENDVKMYGTQTTFCSRRTYNQFENDVKMYGTQTQKRGAAQVASLRMM